MPLTAPIIELRARLAGHAVTIRRIKAEGRRRALKNDSEVVLATDSRRKHAWAFRVEPAGPLKSASRAGGLHFRNEHRDARENRRLADAASDYGRQRLCEQLSAAADKHSARARAVHLVYGLLRGRTYAEMERNPRCRPPLRRVTAIFTRLVGGRDRVFDDWLAAAEAHWRASYDAHLARATARVEQAVTVPA